MWSLLFFIVGAHGLSIPRPDADSHPDESFMSFSIELSSFPEFAGNLSMPNTFTDNLLNNLGAIQGSKPYLRVGGNTQDYALYNASLKTQINGTYDYSRTEDYPTTIFIGPSFFESYQTLPGVKFSHGFNLAKGITPDGWQTLLDTAPLACKALGKDNFYGYEYGNEPNNFPTSGKWSTRPKDWDAKPFTKEWLNGTRAIRKEMRKYCPHLPRKYLEYMAPSYDDRVHNLNASQVWHNGLDRCNNINTYSVHNYIDGATSPGVTLQHTLMNHTRSVLDVDEQVAEYKKIMASGPGHAPLIFGEHNSLYFQGKPGLSNTFGATLWGVDFNMYAAAKGFHRVHMHQGTNYRYQSWQPVETNNTAKGTKAPYYGNIAVASALGNLKHGRTTVASIDMPSDMEAGYGIYKNGQLDKVLVLNMHGYNTTKDGAGVDPLPNPDKRTVRKFAFDVPKHWHGKIVSLQRLMANGSDAITGVTFDGWSYNYELDQGRPVKQTNITTGETAKVNGGVVEVGVPDSSALLFSLQ